ncbi:MAG: cyclic nucleotide-binding domain-containing protein [Acidimicrobiales bacterium]
MAETIALNVAYMLYVGSGFIKTVVRLRIGMIFVSIAYIVWASLAGIWSGVAWNVAFGGVHAYQLYRLWSRHRSISLTHRERELHKRLFPDISVVAFFTLWSIGTARQAMVGEVLIKEQTEQDTIMLVVSGEVVVERGGSLVATLGPDSMIGERSYLTGDLAHATVAVSSEAVIHEWNQQKMTAMVELCPDAHDSLLRFVGVDLATKLH